MIRSSWNNFRRPEPPQQLNRLFRLYNWVMTEGNSVRISIWIHLFVYTFVHRIRVESFKLWESPSCNHGLRIANIAYYILRMPSKQRSGSPCSHSNKTHRPVVYNKTSGVCVHGGKESGGGRVLYGSVEGTYTTDKRTRQNNNIRQIDILRTKINSSKWRK